MKVIDMHCDTILELLNHPEKELFQNDLSIDIQKLQKGNYLLQNFALFTDQNALSIPEQQTMRLMDVFWNEMEKNKEYIIINHLYYNITYLLSLRRDS